MSGAIRTLPVTSPPCDASGEGDKRRRPGRADRTLPGHRRSGSYQVTNAPAGGCRVLPPAPARRFGGRTRDSRSVRRRAKTGTSGRTRPACARVAVDHQRTTLWMSHGAEPLARTNPGGSVRRGRRLAGRRGTGSADLADRCVLGGRYRPSAAGSRCGGPQQGGDHGLCCEMAVAFGGPSAAEHEQLI
jgi:hypothetical protein